jgi:tRNA(His) guanylyltransferase
MDHSNIGDRMKGYENVERRYLTRRTPSLIRLDGRSFHTLTKNFQKPFDPIFIKTMHDTAKYLCENISGCQIAYTQSDEITLLLTDYATLHTQPWFDKNIQKMCSVSASMATASFNSNFHNNYKDSSCWTHGNYKEDMEQLNYYMNVELATFDSRVFNIPKEEVCNNFIWRQQDATRNAILMMGDAHFSHKELQNKSCNNIQEMLFQQKGINFNDTPIYQKRGACIIKETYMKEEVERSRWIVDYEIPIFTQDRNYIEKYL